MQPEAPIDPPVKRAQIILAGLLLAGAVAGAYYRAVHGGGLQQTAALFIGLPALLAIVLALTPHAKTPLGMVMKGMTIALLASGPLLQEGFVCILMASPLFYLVGLVVGLVLNDAKARRSRTRSLLLLAAFMLPPSLEGTHAAFSFSRDEDVECVRVVDAGAADVARALAKTPRFDRPLPLYLRLGFPRPGHTAGAGLEVGDLRRVTFGDMGELSLVVARSAAGRVVFEPLDDTTPIGQWLEWRQAEVAWTPVDERHTRVRWTLRYRRRLDPAWYFGPWERYAVQLAAGYLAETVTTPRAHD